MAITITQNPNNPAPSGNINYCIATSSLQSQGDHQFLFDLYSGATNAFIIRGNIPAGTDGYAIFNLNTILKNYVGDYNFNPTATGITSANQNYFDYTLKLGEEYQYYFSANTVQNYSGLVQISSSTNSHYFITNDRITIATSTFGGNYNIYSAINSSSFVINIPYLPSYSAQTSTSINADSSRTPFSGLTAITGTVINNKFTVYDFINYIPSDYNITSGGSTKKLLTTHPTNYEVQLNSRLWVNAYAANGIDNNQFTVTTYAGGTLEGSFTITGGTNGVKLKQYGVGPWNLNNIATNKVVINSGSLPMIKSTTTSYLYRSVDTGGNGTSAFKTLKVIENCSRFQPIQIIFEDNLGSNIGKFFELKSTVKHSFERNTYKKILGQVTNGVYSYNSYDKSDTIINVNRTKTYNVISDWMTENDYIYLRELIETKNAYAIINNISYPILITDTEFTEKTVLNDSIINLELNFKIAYGE